MRVLDESQKYDQEQVPYQAILRAVGAYLDEHEACRIQIIELVDALMVQYGDGGPSAARQITQCSYADLLTREAELRKQKRRKLRWSASTGSAKPSRYEDVLRALGYELEKGEAHMMALDEVDDGFVLTYQAYSPHEGYMLRKRLLVLGPDQQDMVLTAAYRRRKPQKRTLFTLRAG